MDLPNMKDLVIEKTLPEILCWRVCVAIILYHNWSKAFEFFKAIVPVMFIIKRFVDIMYNAN